MESKIIKWLLIIILSIVAVSMFLSLMIGLFGMLMVV